MHERRYEKLKRKNGEENVMNLKIECPKCGARINLKEQVADLVAEEGRAEANRLMKEEQVKAAEAAEEKIKIAVGRAKTEIIRGFQERFAKKDLEISEIRKKLSEAQARAQEMESKLSLGSAQVQGIIAEEGLGEYLKKNLPLDLCEIEEVGQGKKGTDVIIHVHRNGTRIGAMIVDDKWSADWNRDWPEKIWGDMLRHKAQFGYIAANSSAFPNEELRAAGFGLAPCRRAGVRVWLIDRSNLAFTLAMILDGAEKLIKLAEAKAVHGAGSEVVARIQSYLTDSYELDLREKAKFLSAAVKGLNDIQKKVNVEHRRIIEALRGLWSAEAGVHRSLTGGFGEEAARQLPQIEFDKGSEN